MAYVREGSRVVYVRVFSKPILYWTDAGNRGAKEDGFLHRAKLMVFSEVQESLWRMVELEKCSIRHKCALHHRWLIEKGLWRI